jgi:phosphoglycolate phosphatase-like HAD superfamily hydrolase
MVGILFDLDQTLIESRSAEAVRKLRQWPKVYALIPGFVVYEGIAEVLAMLAEREVPVGIVTTSPGSYCTRVIDHHGFGVTKTVCYHDTSRHKPHPDPILKGIELLGIPASKVWAVGDDPRDIQAAHAAGAHSVAVTWGAADAKALQAAGAEHIFHSVGDLHAFLDALAEAD